LDCARSAVVDSNAASNSENSRISRDQLRLGGVASASVGGGAAAASLEDRLPRGSNLLRQARTRRRSRKTAASRATSCASAASPVPASAAVPLRHLSRIASRSRADPTSCARLAERAR
jgi:hypothetical protein